MDSELEKYCDEIKAFRRQISSENGPQISKKALRSEAERLGTRWYSLLSDIRATQRFSEETLQPYSDAADRLIKLSAPNNKKTSYVSTLAALTKSFRDDLILPLKSGKGLKPPTVFDSFVVNLGDSHDSEYFTEAVSCAKHGFLRAAAVLAWCATIDRIHKKVEQIGFTQFNVVSAQMASQQKGRYKRFTQTQSVTNMSELREVFDTTILWVLEGMQLIDLNQHTRLRACFEMRNHSAHPGDAPITEFNLMSFFSDVDQIVFKNPKFQLAIQA